MNNPGSGPCCPEIPRGNIQFQGLEGLHGCETEREDMGRISGIRIKTMVL